MEADKPAATLCVDRKPMVAICILALSVLALLQFAVNQWRLLWLMTANQPLSDALRSTTGIDGNSLEEKDFGTLLGLCDELSPRIRQKTPWLREVRGYYNLMKSVERAFRPLQPAVATWAGREMKTCVRYLAVVLDQNLALEIDRRAAFRAI